MDSRDCGQVFTPLVQLPLVARPTRRSSASTRTLVTIGSSSSASSTSFGL
jgi:hypothetical protein